MNDAADKQVKLLYDGLCAICSREARILKKKDTEDRLRLVDITSPDFDPSDYGVTREATHAELHLVQPDGTIVTAMDAVREMYRVIGRGWMMAWTGWPILRPIFDLLYRIFAKYRRKWSPAECEDGACSV